MKSKIVAFILFSIFLTSCVSTKSTLKNVDDNAPMPQLTSKNVFLLTEYSKDPKYGYNRDYPINVYYRNVLNDSINQIRFLGALAGPKGEPITYKKIETCCPFPTKKSEIGAGFLDVFEVTWPGQVKPLTLYLNMYERGRLMVPVGLSVKK